MGGMSLCRDADFECRVQQFRGLLGVIGMNVVRESADERIYLKHRDELVRYATVLVGPDAAPDVVSTVVTKVLSSRRSLADLREPRPYLMRGVLNESIRHRETNYRQHTVGLQVTVKQSQPEVLDAVVALPPRQRAAVYLTYWAELRSHEAAHLMGCRSATVRRYLHLANKKLKEALDDYERI
jgi:RNA polymerase sigma-70 factor (ECF subfamily)